MGDRSARYKNKRLLASQRTNELLLQTIPEFLMIGKSNLLCGRNDYIIVVTSEGGGVGSEKLPNGPLNAISLDRTRAGLDRHTKTKMSKRIADPKDHAFPQAKHFALAEELPVLPAIVKAMRGG